MNRLLSLDELKAIQIEILDEVHVFCEKNSLTYFLSSGTLIGAVRHKGYIPWDDDIDLYMPRRDYERFVDSFNQSRSNYRVYCLKTDSSCSIAFSKVEKINTRLIEHVDNPISIGVNIDIFPVDGVPDKMRSRKALFRKIQFIRNLMVVKDVPIDIRARESFKNFVLFLGKAFLHNKSLRDLAIRLDSLIDKNSDNTEFVCNLVLGNGVNSVFPRWCISDIAKVEFEGKEYNTMIGFKEYLKQTYGDYMQLPPKEKQVSHHAFTAYIMDSINSV